MTNFVTNNHFNNAVHKNEYVILNAVTSGYCK